MAGYLEHSRRWQQHPQPRRVDCHREGFEVPCDPKPAWCDGTPHSPDAIPPLPFHDWRYDMDNPWLICARCGERDGGAA